MPKKQVRNAFYFFMKDLEPALRREGRVFPNGLQDVVPIAHPRWKSLPDKEKQRFERMAKEYKGHRRGVEGDKVRMDNVGNIIAHRVDERVEAEKKRAKEIKAVKETFPVGKALADETFYLVNFQTLCKTVDGDYLPAEVAVIEYSIRKGITKKFHTFIEPGRIPTGYRFACQQKSEDYHQIPVGRFDKADSNYRGMWIKLENFVNPNGDKPEYPPMYCLGADCDEMAYCLEWMLGGAALGIPNRLHKVYELEGLVVEMFAHLGPAPSKSSIIEMLTSSTWDYEPKTKCEFHEESECKYCSLGIIRRYAFAISDCICQKYDVDLTKNHIPIRKNVNTSFTMIPPSSMRNETRQAPRQASGGAYRRPHNQAVSPPRFGNQPPPPQQNVTPSFSVPDDDDSDDDDVGYPQLRRPNMPAPGSVGLMAAPAPSRPAWSAAVAPVIRPAVPPSQPTAQDYPSLGQAAPRLPMGRGYMPTAGDFPSLGAALGRGADFPPMGRGTTTNMAMAGIGRGMPKKLAASGDDEEKMKKFAGRAGAPAPTIAPPPPAAWHMAISSDTQSNQNNSTTIPSGVEVLYRRQQAQQSQVPATQAPPPGFAALPPEPVMTQPPAPRVQPPAPHYPLGAMNNGGIMGDSSQSIVNMMRSRGRGILGQTASGPAVPKGRGYAPPGMMGIQQTVQSLSLNS